MTALVALSFFSPSAASAGSIALPAAAEVRPRFQHAGWLVPASALPGGLLAQVEDEDHLEPSAAERLGAMNREQLIMEKARLFDDMPGFGAPIWLLIGATVEGLAGGYLLGFQDTRLLGGVGVVTGLVFLIVGVVMLVHRISQREEARAQIEVVQARLSSYREQPRPGQRDPRQEESWPPPPPPPPAPEPQQMMQRSPGAGPMVVLARF